MKTLFVLLSLTMVLSVRAQVDTLEFTTRRETADLLFENLNSTYYGSALFERSMSSSPILISRLLGKPVPVENAADWLQAYSDLAISYTDSSFMMCDSALMVKLEGFYLEAEMNFLDELRVPFGIFVHKTSVIDSTVYKPVNYFSDSNGHLILDPSIDESQIYQSRVFAGAAALELSSDHGYQEGVLVYDADFISTSSEVTLISIKIDVGNGYQLFDEQNPLNYDIYSDYQVADAAFSYLLASDTLFDTLQFYLTGKLYEYQDKSKSAHGWDDVFDYSDNDEKVLEYAVKYGCGNGAFIRRPIIIAPPYRPSSQSFSFTKYYDQFNYAALIENLKQMGYDVIFIKETPGNLGVDVSGSHLAEFLKDINIIKHEHYPDEDWENIVMGYSAGGQHWRYALKKMEWEHMTWGLPHHHTRLYIPFDSPHWGANVPLFTQAVYKDLSGLNPMAWLSYHSLCDDGSKHMLMNHIKGSVIDEVGHNRDITPYPTTEKANLDQFIRDNYNHQFTPLNDLRRSFPTFSRNVAVSVGSNYADYTTTYSLYPEEELFEQNVSAPTWYGGKHMERKLFASKYGLNNHIFDRNDVYVMFGVPIQIRRYYRTRYAYEWDIAQGGYKDEFYDKGGISAGIEFSGVPISSVQLLITSAMSVIGFAPGTWGNKLYEGHMSFLPMLSSLGINPTIWNDNHLYYSLKDEGLMYKQFSDIPAIKSETFGYPNLAHPTDHFDVTPFEAIYCDPQTYEHIKLDASVAEDQLNDDYLWYTRYFIQNEVEATDVCLQNKVIGDNHIQWQPYRYKAWYKSSDNIFAGESVTPKTDPGPYVIKPTGDITLYACHHVDLKPGFSVQAGGTLHAYIFCDGCYPSYGKSGGTSGGNSGEKSGAGSSSEETGNDPNSGTGHTLRIYPNPSTGKITVEFPFQTGTYYVTDSYGRMLFSEKPVIAQKLYLDLPKGIYQLSWMSGSSLFTEKIIVL